MSIKAKDNMKAWREHIARQVESGLSSRGYCRKHGLQVHQFYYYQKKLGGKPSADSGFARVVINQPAASNHNVNGIRLFIGKDLCLAMDAHSNLSWIAGLIKELRGSH